MDHIELEAKKKDDYSWHPCHVFLSPSNSSKSYLTVDFGTGNSSDTITSEEDALARLRICSIPLQNGECLNVKEGEHVLASHKAGSKGLFLDAVVQKAWRVRHSTKVYCRCTFDIQFLHLESNGETLTVSSSLIRKLSTESIDSHPTVAAFLNSRNSLNNSYPSCISLLEDTNSESDLHSLLEKQIEEISKSADASKKSNSEEILFGLRVDLTRNSWNEKAVSSDIKSLNDDALYNRSNSRRSTRNRSKLQNEMESKDQPNVQSTPLELLDKRPGLSPLAARAAFAALRCELLKKPEISDIHVEKGDLNSSWENSKHINSACLDLTRRHMNSKVIIKENEEFGEHLEGSKPAILRRRNSSSEPSRMLAHQKKPASLAKNSKEKLDRSNTTTTRVTRSTVKGTDNSTNNIVLNLNKSICDTTAGCDQFGEPLEGSNGLNDSKNIWSVQEPLQMVAQQEKPASMGKSSEAKSNRSNTILARVTRSTANRATYNSTNDVELKMEKSTKELIAENNELGKHLEGSKSTESNRMNGSRRPANQEELATVAMNSEGKNPNGSNTIKTRVTRSGISRTDNSTYETENVAMNSEGKKSNGSDTITTRMTRSRISRKDNSTYERATVAINLEGKKSNGSDTITTTETRSSISRPDNSTYEPATVAMNSEGKKSNGSDTMTTRVTRSRISRIDNSAHDVEQNLEKRKSTLNTCYSIEVNDDKSVNEGTKKRKSSSTSDAKRIETEEQEKRSWITSNSTYDVEQNLEKRKSTHNTCYSIVGNDGKSANEGTKKRKSSSTSDAKRIETEEQEKSSWITSNSTYDVEQNLEKRKSTRNTCYSIEGNDDKSMNRGTKKRKSLSTSDAKRIDAEEQEKSSRITSVTPTITENLDKVSSKDKHHEALKLNASGSKKPMSRFSVRLSFLPRTRSQKMS